MAERKKRIDRLITDLGNYKNYVITLEKMAILASNPAVAKRSAKRALGRVDKDLVKIMAITRGYELEMATIIKQTGKKPGKPIREFIDDKTGDVTSLETIGGKPKKRVFQLKSYSGASHKGAYDHIEKATEQIFGMHGEIPANRAKLIIKVLIHSGKCPWPFTLNQFTKWPNIDDAKFEMRAKGAINIILKRAHKAAKAYHAITRPNWANDIKASEFKIVVVFKKQMVDKTKVVTDRSTDGGIGKANFRIKLTSSGAAVSGVEVHRA